MKKRIGLSILFILLLAVSGTEAQTGERIEEIQRQLIRLENKIQEAKHLARLLNNPAVDRTVQQADENYQLARNAFQARQYLQAVQYIKISYGYLAQLYQAIKSNTLYRNRFRERLDKKIAEAEEAISGTDNPDALKMLNRARYYRQRAVQMLESDRPESVFRSYFIALYFAQNALKLATGSDFRDASDFRKYYEESFSLLNQVEEMAGNRPDEMVVSMIQRARNELENVERLYRQKQYRQAFVRLQVANRFLYRAMDILESNPAAMTDRLEFDLQLLRERINDLSADVDASSREDVRKLYERLLFISASASRKFDAGDMTAARRQLVLANKMIYQLHRQLNFGSDSNSEQLSEQLRTAEILVNTLRKRENRSQLYENLMNLLETNYDRAAAAYRENNIQEAWIRIRIFNQLALSLNQLQVAGRADTRLEQQATEGLQRLEMLLEKSGSDNGQNKANPRHENAQKLHDIARQACADGEYQQCLHISKLAIDLLTE